MLPLMNMQTSRMLSAGSGLVTREPSEELNVQVLEEILESSPNHYWALRSLAERCIETGKLERAKKHLETLKQLGCFTGEGGDPSSLACQSSPRARRHGERKGNSEMISNLNASSLPTLNRLIDLSTENDGGKTAPRRSPSPRYQPTSN